MGLEKSTKGGTRETPAVKIAEDVTAWPSVSMSETARCRILRLVVQRPSRTCGSPIARKLLSHSTIRLGHAVVTDKRPCLRRAVPGRPYSGAVVSCAGAAVATVAGVLATVFFAADLTGRLVVFITDWDAFAGPAFTGAFLVAVLFDAALLTTAGACTVDYLVAAFFARFFEAVLVGATVAAFCLRTAAQRLRAAAAIALRPAALRRRFSGVLVTMALFAGEASCALW